MLPPGTLFGGRYEVLRTISTGGMGTVYEVLHRETRRRRALKVMLPDMLRDADLRRRFALEAQITADVESEHIVETFDAGVDAATGSPFIVMELLRGEDLGARLARLSRMSAREVVGVLQQAARALDRTHAAGIVHRDLKPENLFLTQRDDGSLRLKVLDFGIAKVVRETEVGQATRSMGTPLYMAPEQFEGEPRIGPAVDRYALAHIAYTLLVGEPYWAEDARALGSAVALAGRVAKGAEEPASTRAARRGAMLPPEIDAWFARATAPAPEDRFGDVRQQIVELADALGVPDAVDAPLFGSVPREATPVGDRGTSTPRGGDGDPAVDLAGATTQAEPSGGKTDHDLGSRTVEVPEPPRRRSTPWVAIAGIGAVAAAIAAAIAVGGGAPPAPTASGTAVPVSASGLPVFGSVLSVSGSGLPVPVSGSGPGLPSPVSGSGSGLPVPVSASAVPSASGPRSRPPTTGRARATSAPSAPPVPEPPPPAPEPWRTR